MHDVVVQASPPPGIDRLLLPTTGQGRVVQIQLVAVSSKTLFSAVKAVAIRSAIADVLYSALTADDNIPAKMEVLRSIFNNVINNALL